jgi:hypothetical protein
MNRPLVAGMLVGTGVAIAVAISRKAAGGPPPQMWDRMRRHMESLPETAPPRMMFDNVAATRANTEEILELLRAGTTPSRASNE